jgi:hypothetical protein
LNEIVTVLSFVHCTVRHASLLQDHNMQKVLELAGHATAEAGFADWWWKERLGKAYYQLGLLRDAEKQLASAAKNQVGAVQCCMLVPPPACNSTCGYL